MIALIVLRIGLPRMMQFTTNRDSKNTYNSILFHAAVAKCIHAVTKCKHQQQQNASTSSNGKRYTMYSLT